MPEMPERWGDPIWKEYGSRGAQHERNEEILRRYEAGKVVQLAEDFGVSPSRIYAIMRSARRRRETESRRRVRRERNERVRELAARGRVVQGGGGGGLRLPARRPRR